MKAFIFAAGFGTRLKELTKDIPKPLLKVKGRSLIEWNILKLKSAGFDQIIINTHYLGNKIGTGSTVKIINNSLAGVQIISAAEAIILAKKEKIDLKKIFEIINNSSGQSWMFADRGERMIKKEYFKPLSRLSIFKKDMKLANELRKKHFIDLPLTKITLKMYEKGCEQGLENFDDSAVIRLLEKKVLK